MSNALVNNVDALPAHLQTEVGKGNENISSDDLAIPYISLLQSLSKPCTKGTAEYVKGAEAGQFFNSVSKGLTDDFLCANMFVDTIFAVNKMRDKGEDFQGEHTSEAAALDHLEAEGLNPADYDIKEVHKHMLAIFNAETGELESAAIYSFRNTALKASRMWNTQILSKYPNADRFAGIWKVSALTNSNSKGTWFTPQVELVGFANEEVYEVLKERFTTWRG